MRKLFYSLLCMSCFLMLSCEKEEGTGGTSTIKGKVMVREYNGNFTYKIGEYYAGDVDVYIIYGDDEVYGDRFASHHDGTYRFDYLREGKYTIFAYSLDSAAYPLDKTMPVIREVTITGKNQVVEVPDIVVLD